jgi:hypothetical protein
MPGKQPVFGPATGLHKSGCESTKIMKKGPRTRDVMGHPERPELPQEHLVTKLLGVSKLDMRSDGSAA